MAANPQINEVLSATADSLEKKLKPFSNIYEMNYKEGAVLKTFRFVANSDNHAGRLADLWFIHMRSKENIKITPIGKPKPFAIDVERELAKEKKEISA